MTIESILIDYNVGYFVLVAGVITALLKALKIESRWLPLISFLIAGGFTLWLVGFGVVQVAAAVLVGGSASGLYDLAKKTILGK